MGLLRYVFGNQVGSSQGLSQFTPNTSKSYGGILNTLPPPNKQNLPILRNFPVPLDLPQPSNNIKSSVPILQATNQLWPKMDFTLKGLNLGGGYRSTNRSSRFTIYLQNIKWCLRLCFQGRNLTSSITIRRRKETCSFRITLWRIFMDDFETL